MGVLVSTLRSHWRILQPSEPRTLDRRRPPASETEDLKSFIQPLISAFADGIGYSPPSRTSNDALWKAMCLYADQTGLPYEEGTHSWVCFKVGYGYPVVRVGFFVCKNILKANCTTCVGMLPSPSVGGAGICWHLFMARPPPRRRGWQLPPRVPDVP